MAKVTDIQDKNGVSKEIQDKDLANRTSQSTIASSDYVLLEDTDGAYHKIAKASFTEAVRGALGSVINSVAKGTDIAKIPVLDSSNDLGMGTLANVASVLGVDFFKSNVKLQKGQMQVNGTIELPSSTGYKTSINLFTTEGNGAVIVTMWNSYQVIASTTGFDSAFIVSLNQSTNKWEIKNNTGSIRAYAIITLFYN